MRRKKMATNHDDPRIKYFDFTKSFTPSSGFPSFPTLPVPVVTVPPTAPVDLQIADLELKLIKSNDRQELTASVQTNLVVTPILTVTVATVAAAVVTLSLLASATVTYAIYRDSVSPANLVGRFNDSINGAGIGLSVTVPILGIGGIVPVPTVTIPRTTSFEVTDTGATRGDHTYILTASLLSAPALLDISLLALVGLTLGGTAAATISALELNGTVIDENA
jgi:hypothetical protein